MTDAGGAPSPHPSPRREWVGRWMRLAGGVGAVRDRRGGDGGAGRVQHRPRHGGGDAAVRAALGDRHLDGRGRSRRAAAPAVHDRRRAMAPAGHRGRRRSALLQDAVCLRGRAFRAASRRRFSRAGPRRGAIRAGRRTHRFRRVDAHDAGGAAARRGGNAQRLRQASPDRDGDGAGTPVQQGRNPAILSAARALWRQRRRASARQALPISARSRSG